MSSGGPSQEKTPEHTSVYFSDAKELLHHAGDSGLYQILMFSVLGCLQLYKCIEIIAFNFISFTPLYSCAIPALRNYTIKEQLAIASTFSNGNEEYHTACLIPSINWTSYTREQNISYLVNNTVEYIQCPHGFVFESGIFSAATEWGLVCGDNLALDLMPVVYNFGMFVGNLCAGPAGDR